MFAVALRHYGKLSVKKLSASLCVFSVFLVFLWDITITQRNTKKTQSCTKIY